MTDTQSIFSPDRQSVAHLTYFGNIAIGPSSELNAILPIKYEYVQNTNGHLTKLPAGNYMKQYKYPINGNDIVGGDLIVNKGLFHKFNFLVKSGLTKFPRQYISFMDELAKKGPFIFEIKKNGNVILYEKKTKNIIWQTNTANKGKGPYNLHLTNDKILILEDSNRKILYQSDKYIDIPTIYYSNSTKNGPHIYNGLILNPIYFNIFDIPPPFNSFEILLSNKEFRTYINPNQIHIMTENDEKYKITYGGRIKGTDKWFHYDNKGNYHPELYKKDSYIDMFYATFNTDNNDYDICYAVRLYNKGWSSIACNGYKVGGGSDRIKIIHGRRYNVIDYISSLFIYIKEKGEPIPSISKNPTIIQS